MPEAEQTVVGVLKGGTGFRENLRRKKPFSLKAIYLDVSLSAPQKMGHAPNIIFVVSKMANFRNWGTDWDTSGFFKDFLNSSIFKVNTLEVYQLWMDTETSWEEMNARLGMEG